jgi:acetylornithine/succinyldiaminopimelate/putrescine aminotransferase
LNSTESTFYEHLAQTTPFPLGIKIDRAQGSYIYDKEGKAYLDLISGIGVSNLGHGQTAVLEAIQQQAKKHLHVMVYGEFEQDAQNALAEELLLSLPHSLSSFYFLNSGTEANEAAMKLAKRATGRSKIIAFEGAYHGNSQGSLSISFNPKKKLAFRPLLPGISFIRLNEMDDLSFINDEVAAVFLETIQGDAGVRIPDKAYLKALRKRCDECGTLLVFDEIQCGLGRSGKMWAFEHFNVIPDILTAGKALGAGLPIGALIAGKTLMQQLSINPLLGHITTFGGHPLPCAAGAAGLKLMREKNYLEKSQEKAQLFQALLQHPKIIAVRQIGLMIAVELESEEAVQHLVQEALQQGVLLFWFLSTPKAFRLAPPLTISEKEIKEGCAVILAILSALD